MLKTDIKSMNLDELTEYIKNIGQPAFRAKQLYEWMHVKLADSYDEMSNIPAALKQRLQNECDMPVHELVRKQVSAEDKTAKYLFKLEDGNLIDALSSWKFRMYIIPGRMPYGMPVLCIDA